MKWKALVVLAFAAVGFFVVQGVAHACTTIIVGRDLTADHSVLIAHNEEDSGTVVLHWEAVPARPGKAYHLFSGGSVAEPKMSLAYIGAKVWDKSYIPGDFIGGVNQYQVAIYNNSTPSKGENPDDPYALRPDGVMWSEYNLMATLRAHTARQAVQIMGELAQTHKLSGDPGTSFGVADAHEGWWIDISRDGQWAAERVPDNKAEVIANCFRIGVMNFKDHRNFMWSPDLVSYAESRGWYDPLSYRPFNFSQVYGLASSLVNPYNTVRETMVQKYLNAARPIRPQTLMGIMRSHFEGSKYDLSDGYAISPNETSVRTVCRTDTQVSVVTQLRSWLPADIGAVDWQTMQEPDCSAYVPWYLGITGVPKPYTVGSATLQKGSAWWAFENLATYINSNYKATIYKVREAWTPFEARELRMQSAFERHALAVYKHNPAKARALLTAYSGSLGMSAYKEAQTLLKQLDPGATPN
jgi:dipeptidase